MFLRGPEANLIRRDAKEMITSSAESADLIITYRVPHGTPTYDHVYGGWSAEAWIPTMMSGIKAIQQIIKPGKDEDILKWGILEPGDCVFWIDVGIDLSSIDYQDARFHILNDSIEWVPVPRNLESFQNYITLRVGNNSVMQPIACKRVQ